MSYGQKSVVGIVFQDSYGYHVDPARAGDVGSIHFIPFLSENIKLTIPPMYSENIRGIYDEGDTYEGPRTVEGSIETEAQPIAVGAMLKSVLNLASSTLTDSVYLHVYKPRTADFDEFSCSDPVTAYVYLDTGSAMMYPDLNGSALELSIANGEFYKVKVDYTGGNFIQNAAQAASFPVGKRWTWDQSSVSLGGAGVAEISALTITLDESLEAQHTLNNSKYPSRIKRTGFRSISVDGTIKFDNQTEYQQFISQSERAMVITLTGNSDIASGYQDTIKIDLPAMRYEDYSPEASGPGLIEASFTGRAKYLTTSATAMQITLTNTVATY